MDLFVHHTAFIHPSAILYPGVHIGENAYIGPYCIVGARPEIRAFSDSKGVVIGKDVKLEKLVVIDSGSLCPTIIEDESMIMSGCHIGHDVHISQGVTLSPQVVVGGGVKINQYANIGMNVGIHQGQLIGEFSMIGGNSFVPRLSQGNQDSFIFPYATYVGAPVRCAGMNKKYHDIVSEETIHSSRLSFIDKIKSL